MTVERFPVEKTRPGAGQPRDPRLRQIVNESDRMLVEADAQDVGLQHQACHALLLLAGKFSDQRYAWAFHAMVLLILADREVDLLTLADELRRLGKFEQIGGAEFIESLIEEFEDAKQ